MCSGLGSRHRNVALTRWAILGSNQTHIPLSQGAMVPKPVPRATCMQYRSLDLEDGKASGHPIKDTRCARVLRVSPLTAFLRPKSGNHRPEGGGMGEP